MKIVCLTGAGISADSGIRTYRDADGLWQKHDPNVFSSRDFFNTEEGQLFYSKLYTEIKDKQPNRAHFILKELEDKHEVIILTQNIDDLHEKAGSKNVIHLHGSLINPVLFGESLDKNILDSAIKASEEADIFISIGTSDMVAPACDLIIYTNLNCRKYQINKEATPNTPYFLHTHLGKTAAEGLTELWTILNK